MTIGSYDICTVQFPKHFEYHMLLWPEIHHVAFNPMINDLFVASTMKKKMHSLMRREYDIVAPARNRLYCCTGVRMLTDSVFNAISDDTVAHGYSKRHHHSIFTPEIFSFASTIVSNPI